MLNPRVGKDGRLKLFFLEMISYNLALIIRWGYNVEEANFRAQLRFYLSKHSLVLPKLMRLRGSEHRICISANNCFSFASCSTSCFRAVILGSVWYRSCPLMLRGSSAAERADMGAATESKRQHTVVLTCCFDHEDYKKVLHIRFLSTVQNSSLDYLHAYPAKSRKRKGEQISPLIHFKFAP